MLYCIPKNGAKIKSGLGDQLRIDRHNYVVLRKSHCNHKENTYRNHTKGNEKGMKACHFKSQQNIKEDG